MTSRGICFISKYPPIEGGVSSRTYWLLRGLGKRGHRIHLVSNAWEVEAEYREEFEGEDIDQYQPENVSVHNTNPFSDPKYIPYSPPYTEKISSLAIETVREHDLDLIDSWYFLPYGVSGFITKTFCSKSLVIRHAGSDMGRLLTSPYLHTILSEVVRSADMIVTYPGNKDTFLGLGVPEDRLSLDTTASVDPSVFNPRVEPYELRGVKGTDEGVPVITYIGKVSAAKGIYELTEALHRIDEDFLLLLVCGGRELNRLKADVEQKGLGDKTVFLGFKPPWQIPRILKLSTCVVIPERDFPIGSHTPILPREAMATGRCTVLSDELFNKRRYLDAKNGIHTLVVDPLNIDEFSKTLVEVIRDPDRAEAVGAEAAKLAEKHEDFNGYLLSTEKMYDEILELS